MKNDSNSWNISDFYENVLEHGLLTEDETQDGVRKLRDYEEDLDERCIRNFIKMNIYI